MTNKTNWNTERIIGFSAIFMSACALLVSVYQTRIMQQQQEIAVWPYIQADIFIKENLNKDNIFDLNVQNKGVGPAIIDSCLISTDTFSYQSFSDFIDQQIGKEKMDGEYGYTNLYPRRILAQNESVSVVNALGLKTKEKIHSIFQNQKITIKIWYSSVYGKRWCFTWLEGKNTTEAL